jgi:hypothetical protein
MKLSGRTVIAAAVGACMALGYGCGARHAIKATSPNSEVVEADGSAPIVNNDIAAARKSSLDDALKNALGLVIGVYVSQEALVSKAVLIEDSITSQTEGYIEKYETLKEGRSGDFYSTRIRALVRREDLSAKLKALELEPKKLGNPAVRINVDEYIDGASATTRTAENELKKVFVEKGFSVTDGDAFDIMLTGRVDSGINTDSGLAGMISYRAAISLRALASGTSDVISAVTDTLGGIDVSRDGAAKAAMVNASRRAGGDISGKVPDSLNKRSIVSLTVCNIANINSLNEFTKSVRSLIEVRDCWVRSYQDGVARMDMDLKKGSASDVARRIETLRGGVRIKEVNRYGISAEFEGK